MSYSTPPRTGVDTSGLVWGILVTLFCCLPFGIVAIVKAAQGDGDGARRWAGWGAGIGLVVIVIAVLAQAGSRS